MDTIRFKNDGAMRKRFFHESLGFAKFDEWRRELWSLSFWYILQRRRDPAAFDDRLNYESVLAFRKREGAYD